jgi:sirohydrochlorin ferrochelatase
MSSDPDAATVALAQARAAAARQRLSETAGTLQARLNPRVVARDAVDGLTESGEKALRTGVETARAHPDAVMVGASIAIAWLTRRRIAWLFKRRKRATPQSLARSIPGDWQDASDSPTRLRGKIDDPNA